MKFKELFAKLTKKQCVEFGLVAILVNISLSLYLHESYFVVISLILILITIIFPILFYPIAILWFGLSHIMGTISTKIIMTLVFFILVIPVGIVRKLMGKDSLRVNQFKKGTHSVMLERNHTYTNDDLLNTF